MMLKGLYAFGFPRVCRRVRFFSQTHLELTANEFRTSISVCEINSIQNLTDDTKRVRLRVLKPLPFMYQVNYLR